MGAYHLVSTLLAGTIRLLPEHLDLFTACDGCAGVCGVLGSMVAMTAERDIAKGATVGAMFGFFLGTALTFLQASGVRS